MRFFSKANFRRAGIGVGVSGLVFACALALHTGISGVAQAQGEAGQNQTENVQEERFAPLAVVDFDKLLQDQPGYERIRQIDEQIRILQQELEFLPLADRKRKVDSGRKRMEREVEKARNELQAESRRINSELEHFQSNLSAQLEREGRALGEHYQQVLNERIAALTPKAAPQVPKDIQMRMQSFIDDLAGVRQQRIEAKRLELNAKASQEIEAEQASVDERLAAFDDSLMASNKTKRLNLKLQMDTAANAEEEAAIQDQLAALDAEENQARDAKRKELVAESDAKAAEARAAIDSQLKAFETQLDAETQSKVRAEQERLLKEMPPPPQINKAEVEAQIAKIKATVDAEMEAKKAEMTATLRAKAEEARRRMEKKQADTEARLFKVQKQLEDMVNSSSKDVSDDTRKKMDDLKAKIADLQKQRQELYDSMATDLRGVVAKIAEKQEEVPSVIGVYFLNIDCLDLTDKTMIALEQESQPLGGRSE
ncbi:MAG: hypothetical protein K6A35_10695 [bacterium]|nr:hypothetical protein [bacterium]